MSCRAALIGVLLLSAAACRSGWGPPRSAHGCVADDAGVPRIARASVPDSALLRQGAAALEVFVDTTGAPRALWQFRNARIELKGRYLYADSLGHATLTDLHDRKVRLEIRRSNTYAAHGPVKLRTGYRDTLRIALAEIIVCGTVSN